MLDLPGEMASDHAETRKFALNSLSISQEVTLR
jgi:hypothetical protein